MEEKNLESPVGEITSINVSNLSYVPNRKLFKQYLEYLRYQLSVVNLGWLIPFYKGEHRKILIMGAPLRNITFTAFAGDLTAILGSEMERREVIELLTGRKKEGTFDGSISLRGGQIPAGSYYYDHVAHVQKKSLFIPGLTFVDMIRFAVQLRVNFTAAEVEQRVDDIITIMNLHRSKNKTIPEYPPTRGDLGCEIRRLSIALEIVHLPPVIVLDEPTLDFEPAISVKIMHCLKTLTKRGHIIICSMEKPSHAEFSLLDRVVMITEGHSIYSGPTDKLETHFCSQEMGYVRKRGVELVDFATDICSGIERPDTMRVAEAPWIMQEKFEGSAIFATPSHDPTNSHAFTPEFFKAFGLLAHMPPLGVQIRRFSVVLRRAVVTKLKDFTYLRALVMGSSFLSSIIGYLQYGQGSYGNYCLNLVGIPYKNTTNVGSLIFFTSLFTQAFFFVDAHAHCQKLQLFRYEQASSCNNAASFFLAMVISEVPFALFFGVVFGNILFNMAKLYGSVDDYGYFISVVLMAALVGLSCTVMFCALFKKELAVRDMFFLSLAIVVLLSGFPFTQPNMPDYMVSFSQIIPTRWIFEALYKWYFSRKVDGFLYLGSYDYNSFDRSEIFVILTDFLIGINCITILFLMPEPLWMHRTVSTSGTRRGVEDSRDSIASNNSDFDGADGGKFPPRMSQRESETVQPIMFMRASTVTGRNSKLSVNMSQMGEENTSRGPTVMMNEISYRVRDSASPMGYKTVLNRISGQFDWGKLNMIMGAPQCGKTSLINIIAGNVGVGAEVCGQVTFNGLEPKPETPLWERCGYVPMHNEHIRDLSVTEVITFAMKLRCYNRMGLAVVEENVATTIANLHLADVANKKVKFLNKGEYKRLSIAEEMVHGPKLLLMDEPTTGVSLYETSILMMTFREMVNADRTVVATMYQPTQEAFNLFDSLMLLSKGRVIYSGRVSGATEFFATSPYQYSLEGFSNPADFLADISAGELSDCRGEFIDGSLLENHYMQTENFKRLQARLNNVASSAAARVEGSRNPMLAYAASPSSMSSAPHNSDAEKTQSSSVSLSVSQHSFELERETESKTGYHQFFKRPLPTFVLACVAALQMIFKRPSWDEFTTSLFKRQILLHRAYCALWNRFELITGSLILHIMLGLLFAWVNEFVTPASVIAYLGIGTLFLLLANAQFVFYVFTNHHVFLKEHSRGLYSAYTNYTVSSIPMYLLKIINAVLFVVTSWPIMNVDNSTKTFGYMLLVFIAAVLCCTMLAEIAIYQSETLAAAYILISVLGGLEFLCSGLILKAGSFPDWLGPWVPSISLLRWIMQGGFIRVYNNNTDAFPPLFPFSTYTQYTGYLDLFGWGGKTEWYCFWMIVINIAVFRIGCLVVSAYVAFKAKGTHKMKIEF